MAYACKEKQRDFQKSHYEANKADYVARAKKGKIATKEIIQEFIRQYLRKNPCVDCGEPDLVVLEFDHRPDSGKAFNIGSAAQLGFCLKKVVEEISKCDVRCANCHRRKTYKERGFSHRS